VQLLQVEEAHGKLLGTSTWRREVGDPTKRKVLAKGKPGKGK